MLVSDEAAASEIGVLPLDGSPAVLLRNTVLGADPALAVSAARRFASARDLGTIFEVDACGLAAAQFALKTGSEKPDPWDVSVASDGTLWIARYLEPSALVLGADGHVVTTIDLSQFERNGATPDASGVRVVSTPNGEKALFLLERLDSSYASVAPAVIAVVDAKTHVVETSIALAGENPQALSTQAEEAGAIYIAAAGSWDDAGEANAGIERFDTATFETKLIFDEKALGGSPTTVAVSQGCGAAIVADPTTVNRTSLVVFALVGSTPPHTVLGPTTGFDLHGVSWTKDRLLVGDGATRRVHTFSVGPSCTVMPAADLAQLPMAPVAFAE